MMRSRVAWPLRVGGTASSVAMLDASILDAPIQSLTESVSVSQVVDAERRRQAWRRVRSTAQQRCRNALSCGRRGLSLFRPVRARVEQDWLARGRDDRRLPEPASVWVVKDAAWRIVPAVSGTSGHVPRPEARCRSVPAEHDAVTGWVRIPTRAAVAAAIRRVGYAASVCSTCVLVQQPACG